MVLQMDRAAVPTGLTVETWYQLYNTFDIILYDSTTGEAPKLIDGEGMFDESILLLNLTNREEFKKAKTITGIQFNEKYK